MSESVRRIILIMFEEDYQYLPSLREIKDSLVRAQKRFLEKDVDKWSNKTKFALLLDIYKTNWDKLFQIDKLGNIDKPLTQSILSNPYHPITRHIIYLYSMQSFIYQDLNRACRKQNEEDIQYFGAFAAALSFILYNANSGRPDKIRGKTVLFRGLKLSYDELE